MIDHYTILGVDRSATPEEIKRAYRKLASQHHPDRGGDTGRFQEIQVAYDTLSDPDRRAAYDNPAAQFGRTPGGFHFNFGGDINDVFRNMFGQGFAQHQQRRPQPFVRMSLWIRLTDVITGGRRPVAVNTGTGSNTIEIDIPQGVDDGETIQYPRLAPGGLDLIVQFRVQPDSRWIRDGLNLVVSQDVSIWDMILGGEVSVSTIAGEQIAVRVPARCQPRTVLRLRGRGIAKPNGQTGDIMVKVNPVIPDLIDPDLLAAIARWRA